MTARLDFYFFIGSTYGYLSVNRAATLAQARGVTLDWRPLSLRTLMREQRNIPFADKPAKQRYMWRDLERGADRSRPGDRHFRLADLRPRHRDLLGRRSARGRAGLGARQSARLRPRSRRPMSG